MALITCRKCKRIVASSSEPCPYCGEPSPADAPGQREARPPQARQAWIAFAVLALLVILLLQWYAGGGRHDATVAVADPAAQDMTTCLIAECPAGTRAVTFTTRQEPYYSCKSDELSAYANYVLGVMIAHMLPTGAAPEIGKTGEPVVQGSEKQALDRLREKAGVSTFEEAIAKCYRGEGNLKVQVLYSPKGSDSIYVAAEEHQENKFWMPKARLLRKAH
ncbi:hypothetical protein GALL_01020 [mine drainage metagenome]|uniref:Uncharacterized protein n=1 Tax=mine drainage metagenome TaxID=410659 RepID=A0A1J5TE93_9ZZZZ